MLTIFSTPKAFRGHIGVIQRNALASWKRLHPDVEVILFGDDEGAAGASRELGLRHVPEVERTPRGSKLLGAIFGPAQRMARHSVVAYSNADIILCGDFLAAVQRTLEWARAARRKQFLMAGRRWDADVREPLDFSSPDWAPRIKSLARAAGRQRPPQWIDYFVFPRGMYPEIPPLVIGRVGWDNWLIWKARQQGAAVVDASASVLAVHQNHDYAYHPQGELGVWHDEEARRNVELAGGDRSCFTLRDATHRLTPSGMRACRLHSLAPASRAARRAAHSALHWALCVTRPVRHALGLRKSALDIVRGRS
jgi:hypothetical protein